MSFIAAPKPIAIDDSMCHIYTHNPYGGPVSYNAAFGFPTGAASCPYPFEAEAHPYPRHAAQSETSSGNTSARSTPPPSPTAYAMTAQQLQRTFTGRSKIVISGIESLGPQARTILWTQCLYWKLPVADIDVKGPTPSTPQCAVLFLKMTPAESASWVESNRDIIYYQGGYEWRVAMAKHQPQQISFEQYQQRQSVKQLDRRV